MSDHDLELLARYTGEKAEDAFAEIVRRHLDLVYSTALRQVRSPQLAEEVAQATFLSLASDANRLTPDTILAAWLYRVAHRTAANVVRREARRQLREQIATEMNAINATAADWTHIEPMLDEAMHALDETDRAAVLLRYFENKSLRDVGTTLGTSENAAQKRLGRAVERLREFFAKRGITVGASGLIVVLSANAVQAAPVGLAVTISTATALAGTTLLTTTTATVGKAIAMTTLQKALVAVALTVVGSAITLIVYEWPKPPSTTALAPAAPVGSEPFLHKAAEYAAFPYAKGFPLVLPGSITGSAVVLDLDGDGKLEIAVPCVGRLPQHYNRYDRELHPSPSLAGQIFAFRADGSTYPNFPMVIRDAAFRQRWERLDWHWNFSPSVADTDKNGTDELIVGGHVLFGDGMHETLSDNQEPYGSVALADVDGDGDLDMLAGWTGHSVRGAPIRGWPRDRKFFSGYSPAVGDADGDGLIEIFHPHYGPAKIFGGYDHLKQPLPGWPQPIADPIIYPVMGDMDGDGKAEILGVDFSTRSLLGLLHAWHHDGRPLAACKKIDDDDSIFKTDLFSGFTHPALADLDGDGAAEILILDWESGSVRAWKSDGNPAFPPGDPSLPDGHLVTLPPQRNSGYGAAGGISVADLGNDGVMDVFVGTTWFQLTRDGKSRAIDLTPGHPQCTVTPTIADLDGDGKADILFGTTDGRLFVYQTGLEIRPEWVEWAMQEGNVRHTAMWVPRKSRTGRP